MIDIPFINQIGELVRKLYRKNITGALDANVTDGSLLGHVMAKTDVTNFDRTTDSLEGIADTVAGLNNVSAADVNAQADQALIDYDPPTKAELDVAVTTIRGADYDTLKSLSDQIDAILPADISVPAANSTANLDAADVLGNKTDNEIEDVSTIASLMGYMKGIVREMSQRDNAKAAYAVATTTYADLVNISDKGVLTGITQLSDNISSTSVGSIIVTIDGTVILTAEPFFTVNSGDYACGGVLSFNHRFNTSLRIQHKKNSSYIMQTMATYTVD
jgi:hypothetical protein